MPRRKMVDRVTNGQLGLGKELSPVAGAPEAAIHPGVGLLVQAQKALSFRSPFDAEDSAPRVPTLPSGLASFLSRASESHRKQKKPQGESAEKPSGNGKPPTVWDETEEYFRPLTLVDFDLLLPKLHSGFSSLSTFLAMPEAGNGTVDFKEDSNLDSAAVELSSILLPENEKVLSENHENEVEMVPVAAEVQPIGVDEVVIPNGETLPVQVGNDVQVGNGDSLSLHWLLGSKERFVLTSERPNKKRKLLGGDAGLDRLLQLPHLPSVVAPLCDFCCSAESTVKSNKLLHCNSCKVLVHQKCYGVHEVPEGVWFCNWCKQLEIPGKSSDMDGEISGIRPCLLCPKEGGALKMVRWDSPINISDATTKYAHLFCSLWTPEMHVKDTGAMELVVDVGGIEDTRKRLVCNVCKVKHGVCIRCSHGTCRTSFHPLCARESKHQMEIWGKFGCDNVELRAFCSKHSTFQDLRSAKDSNIMVVDDNSFDAKPSSAVQSNRNLPMLRFTRKNRDKITMQNENANLNSEKIVQMVPDLDENTLVSRLHPECGQAGPNAAIDSDGFNKNTIDVAATLRKLIGCGNINSGDVASEMGISLDSLQAALIGETTSFSPGLRLKIIKWLQNSSHFSTVQSPKVRRIPVISSDYKVKNTDCLNTAIENDLRNNHAGDEVTSVEVSDAVVVKSLPPRAGLKNNIRILKNNKALRSSGVASVLENGNGEIVDETNDIPTVICEGVKRNIDGKKHSNLIEASPNEPKLQDMQLMEDTFMAEEPIPHQDPFEGQKRSSSRIDINDSSDVEHKAKDAEEIVSYDDHASYQTDDANPMPNALERGWSTWSKKFDGGNVACSSKSNHENEGFGHFSNIHPLIKNKLLHMQNSLFFKTNDKSPPSNVCVEKPAFASKAASSICPFCNQQRLPCFCTGTKYRLDGTRFDQLSLAKSMGFLELSPEDEVEGEMVYLQAKLLDNDVAIRHNYEDLLLKIVRNLPHELSSSNKRKWDLILVNQYLREVREAKKRGRKERRHKEAQAVLAAAAAAAAASSRNPSLRKDTNDETISATQESPVKVNAATSRAGLQVPVVPRTREALRSSATKLSSDKHSLVFQMPDFLKDNALFCEICMRTETILNRVFICSSCKVSVHLDCYRRLKHPIGSWKCELCEDTLLPSASPENGTGGRDRNVTAAQCGLCGGVAGAMRKSADGQWVHALCAEWLLESSFRRGQENLVEGMDTILKEKDTCCICNHNIGLCLRCSHGQCSNTFHPSCARAAGFYMNTKATGASLKHKAYCGRHSIEQREIHYQQCATEDLKSLKQIRVEMEKLRLLCERIIKREKLKKELVVCSHDMLSTRRDYAAYSVLVRSSFFPRGDSSESATTSINNRSYSGTVQRSDEITVDSSVSSKPATRFSLNNRDLDRNTDDSSTSQLSFKWKLTNRTSLAGKQLPRRSTSIASRRSTEIAGKNAKTGKTETFQKELVMTSDQASMQNQRLPKGFFYIPVGSLSKETTLTQDLESCEPQEPGG
ncbi:hypothetical protein Cni_G28839 [Canna indica]|uniref:PHD finger family protein n=1 Tax=Canna indica TaxID=4628 RepID=A0AAQ3L376_9LILI|nr:hypothetical protein Cni_G28839 [Canna indica]